jgi:hypothetical protein
MLVIVSLCLSRLAVSEVLMRRDAVKVHAKYS